MFHKRIAADDSAAIRFYWHLYLRAYLINS